MDGVTDQELKALANIAGASEEKKNTHTFLHSVATAKDTTKLGYLREEEVGVPTLSTRTLKELALYAKDIADEPAWANYFNARSEILTSTSLSKEAKLLELAVVTKQEVSSLATTQPQQENKGWFKPKKQYKPLPQM